jgi:hypothetical protein
MPPNKAMMMIILNRPIWGTGVTGAWRRFIPTKTLSKAMLRA